MAFGNHLRRTCIHSWIKILWTTLRYVDATIFVSNSSNSFSSTLNSIDSNSLFLTSIAEWLYKVFISQACVYELQIQYRKSNEILTNVIQRLYSDNVINQQLKEAIENYQVKITGKQRYFAFYCRKTIPSEVLKDIKGGDDGTYLPKHYVMNTKGL